MEPPAVALERAAYRRRELDRAVVEGLEQRGLEAVRILLVLGGAPGQPGNIAGLYDLNGNYISRADAELWVERQTRQTRRRDTVRYYVLLFLASVASLGAAIAALATIFGHR